jgi:peptidyl-tRNA hydrolase
MSFAFDLHAPSKHCVVSRQALLYQLAREERLTLCNFRELNMTECAVHDARCHQVRPTPMTKLRIGPVGVFKLAGR